MSKLLSQPPDLPETVDGLAEICSVFVDRVAALAQARKLSVLEHAHSADDPSTAKLAVGIGAKASALGRRGGFFHPVLTYPQWTGRQWLRSRQSSWPW